MLSANRKFKHLLPVASKLLSFGLFCFWSWSTTLTPLEVTYAERIGDISSVSSMSLLPLRSHSVLAPPESSGFCRETESSSLLHTLEDCKTIRYCTQTPAIQDACRTQGHISLLNDMFMLLQDGNGCRYSTELDACIPLRNYCFMKISSSSCYDLDGCEWVNMSDYQKQDSMPTEDKSQSDYYPIHTIAKKKYYKAIGNKVDIDPNPMTQKDYLKDSLNMHTIMLYDIECKIDQNFRKLNRKPCQIHKDIKPTTTKLTQQFLHTSLGKSMTNPITRYRWLTGREMCYNVPHHDCERCKEYGSSCIEDAECCSGNCISKSVSNLFGKTLGHVSCSLMNPCTCEKPTGNDQKVTKIKTNKAVHGSDMRSVKIHHHSMPGGHHSMPGLHERKQIDSMSTYGSTPGIHEHHEQRRVSSTTRLPPLNQIQNKTNLKKKKQLHQSPLVTGPGHNLVTGPGHNVATHLK